MAHVLVIEDHAPLRLLIRQVLEDHAYTVADAADGEKGTSLLKTFAADLIITDIFMPNRDGIETIRAVRRHWPQVKLLAMSGWQSEQGFGVLDSALDFGAHGVLSKPFGVHDLLLAVETLLCGDAKAARKSGEYSI